MCDFIVLFLIINLNTYEIIIEYLNAQKKDPRLRGPFHQTEPTITYQFFGLKLKYLRNSSLTFSSLNCP